MLLSLRMTCQILEGNSCIQYHVRLGHGHAAELRQIPDCLRLPFHSLRFFMCIFHHLYLSNSVFSTQLEVPSIQIKHKIPLMIRTVQNLK